MYSQPGTPVSGISAVKALQLANDQGIPVYTINLSNITTVLPQLQIDVAAKDDIVNAVNAGKVVTVAKANVNYYGWMGCGYIVTDPSTGAGAYMISGGANGAALAGAWGVIFVLGALAAPALIAGGFGIFVAFTLLFIAHWFIYFEYLQLFGMERTDAFVECTAKLFSIHYIVHKFAHYLPMVLQDYVQRFMAVEGTYTASECWNNFAAP